MRFAFPKTTFARTLSIEEQLVHVFSEVDELAACGPEVTDELLGEAFDLYHSLETLFRIVERERGAIAVHDLQHAVFAKNFARGYYEGTRGV